MSVYLRALACVCGCGTRVLVVCVCLFFSEHVCAHLNICLMYTGAYTCRIFDLLAPADAVGEFQVVEDRVKGTVVRGA